MKLLRWWMRIVGTLYLVLGFANLPPAVRARIASMYPGWSTGPRQVETLAIVDTWFMFGIEVGVVGLALIVFSRRPLEARALVWTVLVLELLRGILHDLHVAMRDYSSAAFYLGFAAVHLAIIGTGWVALRKAREEKEAPIPIHG